MTKFQVYKDVSGKFRFRLRAGNNQIVAVGEAYKQRSSCINGIRSIQKNCNSEIEDLTLEGPKVPNPKYQIYKDTADKFRFRLKAANGEIIAEGEGYESKEGCLNGINVVKSSCEAEIEDLSAPKEPIKENVTPIKTEETDLSQKVETETPLGYETGKESEVPPAKIETPVAPSVTGASSETETISSQPKMEESIQAMPTPIVTNVPSNLPIETKLELYAVPEKMKKGESAVLKGKLSEINSGKGISGAKIRIHERDTSILGDAYLAHGITGEDGSFSIGWKVKRLTWRKNTGNIYAIFYGNETLKPSKSSIQPVIID